MMNPEAWAILAVGVALGGLLWRMLRSLRPGAAGRAVMARATPGP